VEQPCTQGEGQENCGYDYDSTILMRRGFGVLDWEACLSALLSRGGLRSLRWLFMGRLGLRSGGGWREGRISRGL
jgi:hypothetical protein